MKIPHSERGVIDAEKVRSYLLSTAHPVGRLKAGFFRRLGYAADDWERLVSDLRSQHLSRDATMSERTAYGQKYEIRATLVGPAGVSTEVVTIWIVLSGEEAPRFITAFPGGVR